MKAGNVVYNTSADLPDQAPVFPLAGALLLPGSQLSLNILEKCHMDMFDDAIADNRLIAMIQPLDNLSKKENTDNSDLSFYEIGCLGRITAFQETGDGQYLANLSGICRYRLLSQVETGSSYRIFSIENFEGDLINVKQGSGVDREKLLKTFHNYLEANQMETDWENVEKTNTDQLVNTLCMMSPYGTAEKQAMLEAGSLATRAETLIAITEFELARINYGAGSRLQ